MKKFLKLCAAFTLIGALFVGCIDNKEPEGVLEMRMAKAELLRAQAKLTLAKIVVEDAKASFILAAADYVKARAKYVDALTELKKTENEREKLANEFEKAVLQARIDYEIAKLNVMIEKELNKLAAEKRKGVKAIYLWYEEIIKLEKDLEKAKITNCDRIITKMRALIIEKAGLEAQVAEWMARRIMYLAVEVPKIEAILAYELEQAQFLFNIAEHALNMWEELKDLAIDQFESYLPKVEQDLKEAFAKSTELRLAADMEQFNLEELKKKVSDAELDYKYGGGLHTPIVENVFSKVADDFFRIGSVVNQGLNHSLGAKNVTIFTGVVNNTYSFYAEGEPFGAKAQLGAKNTMEQLILDSIYIEKNRIIRGVEGEALAKANLDKRDKDMTTAIANFNNDMTKWRTNYAIAITPDYWKATSDTYDDAVDAFTGLYGFLKGTNNKIEFTQAQIEAGAKALMELVATMNKDGVTNPDLRAEKVLAIANMSTLNFKYLVLTHLISTYVKNVKYLLFEEGEIDLDWKLELDKHLQISDVLGGITFNPGGLLELLWTGKNVKAFQDLINMILGYAYTYDLVAAVAELMPTYYANYLFFQGAIDPIKLATVGYTQAEMLEILKNEGPIMGKYGVSQPWEYHIWFLLYVLLENPGMINIGNVISINSSGYTDADLQIRTDFLKYTAVNFPGYYSTATCLTKATAPAAGNRVFPSGAKSPYSALVITAEANLRTRWIGYQNAVDTLNAVDARLYTPYHRKWGTGSTNCNGWLTDDFNKAAVGTPGDATKDFQFKPELTTGTYPPYLTEDVLYWTRNFVPYEYIHFADDQLSDNIGTNTSWWWAYYPSLAVHRVALTGTQYNRWVNIGSPIYLGDPVLWEANTGWAAFSTTAPAIPTARAARAFIAIRNYNQFKFWYDENVDANSYHKLLDAISDEIAALRPVVEDLYNKWVAAEQERVFKDFEIKAMHFQADVFENHYFAMLDVINHMIAETAAHIWAPTYYKDAFDNFVKYQAQLTAAEENIKLFNTLGIYHNGLILADSDHANFVENRVKHIDAHIASLQERIDIIDAELKILDKEKDTILALVI
ncbi:MAG: hypothetical protein LBC84_01880 [Prevotellaceae bacterium]|jgi:hypothetical protein|nr:hypothetical protein [Prevotellaceae bacterium]